MKHENTVVVRYTDNNKWIKDVVYSFAKHTRIPKFTSNKQLAFKFKDKTHALQMLNTIDNYKLSHWEVKHYNLNRAVASLMRRHYTTIITEITDYADSYFKVEIPELEGLEFYIDDIRMIDVDLEKFKRAWFESRLINNQYIPLSKKASVVLYKEQTVGDTYND